MRLLVEVDDDLVVMVEDLIQKFRLPEAKVEDLLVRLLREWVLTNKGRR